MEKTPITLLNEYCTKNKIILSFTLLPSPSKKEFTYRAEAGSTFAIATGPSKKSAKHNSAQKLFFQFNPSESNLLNAPNHQIKIVKESPNNPVNGIENLKNSIVELHELSQQMKWPLPLYEFSSINSPTEPFTCTVRLDLHIKTGQGKSKKQAKLNASSLLLASLRKNAYNGNVVNSENGEIALNSNSDYLRAVEDLSSLLKVNTINVLKPSDSKAIAQFYNSLKSKPEKTLALLQTISLNRPSTNYVQMLQEIAEEQKFVIEYIALPERTIDGQMQCVAQLGSLPVGVVHGTGLTSDHAQYQAAHNALQYLKILTRKI